MPPLDDHLQMRSFDVAGAERSFWIPDRRPRGADTGLLIALHDQGETGRRLAHRSGLAHAATTAGWNVVFPDALERVWDDHGSGRRDGADDDTLIATLIVHLRGRGEFGEEPPVLVGYGENGAGFAERLAREGVHELGGVLLLGGSAREASREMTPVPVRPVPLLVSGPAPRAGARRPGLRARLALRQTAGHGLVERSVLLADWRAADAQVTEADLDPSDGGAVVAAAQALTRRGTS